MRNFKIDNEAWARAGASKAPFNPSGQTHLNSEELEEIIVIPSSAQAFDLETIFGRALLLEEIEGDVSNNRQILGCEIGSGAIGILMKGDIERPVKLIFNQPVSPSSLCELVCIRR